MPLAEDEVAAHGGDVKATVTDMIAASVDRIFAEVDAPRYASGALLRNVVDRAKTRAIKHVISGGERGISTAHLLASCDQELAEARAVAAGSLGEH